MVDSVVLSWILTIVFAATGLWFLSGFARAVHGSGEAKVVERVSNVAHAAMCAAVIAMTWLWGGKVPGWLQLAVFGCATVWFLALVTRPQLRSAQYPQGSGGLGYLHHALMMAAVIW